MKVTTGWRTIKELEPGDMVVCQGIKATIKEIKYQFYDERNDFGTGELFDVEFIDTNGSYRSWKSQWDGGYVIPKGGSNGKN